MCVCVYVCMRVCVYTCFQLTINRGLNTILAGVRRGGGQVEEKGLRVPLATSLHYNSLVPASRSKHGTTKQQGVGFWRGAWMRDAAPSGKSRERRRSFSTSTRPSAHELSPPLLQSSSLSPLSSPPPPPSPPPSPPLPLPLPSPSPSPLAAARMATWISSRWWWVLFLDQLPHLVDEIRQAKTQQDRSCSE